MGKPSETLGIRRVSLGSRRRARGDAEAALAVLEAIASGHIDGAGSTDHMLGAVEGP